MSKQTEGNKLIADFMGWIHHFEKSYDKFEMKSLKYHSSWEWLWPVIGKIKDIKGTEFSIQIRYAETYVGIKTPAFGKRFFVSDKDPMRAVWSAVVEFIKWYNQNKKP